MGSQCHQDHKTAILIALGVLCFLLAFVPPMNYSVDGNSMLSVAESLASSLHFNVPKSLGQLGIDGKYYSIWYPLMSILAVPLMWIGFALAHLAGMANQSHFVAVAVALLLPAFLMSALSAMVYLFSVQLGAARKNAVFAALGSFFGTCLLTYSRTFFADPLLALILIASLYFTFKGDPTSLRIVGLLAACAVLAKPTGVFLSAPLALYLFLEKRSFKSVLLPLWGTLIGLMLYFFYNQVRFGSPFDFGSRSGNLDLFFIPTGMARLFFSPGFSLFLYNPATILFFFSIPSLVRLKSRKVGITLLMIAFYLLIYSGWSTYGWDWGSRHLLMVIPILFAGLSLSLFSLQRKIFLGAVLLGFIVNAPTLISFYERYYFELYEKNISQETAIWSVRQSPLLHAWPSAVEQVKSALHSDVKGLVQKASSRGSVRTTMKDSIAFQIVPVWWWILPVFGISKLFGILSSLILIGMSALFFRRALILGVLDKI